MHRFMRLSAAVGLAALSVGAIAPGAVTALEVPLQAVLRGSNVVADDGTPIPGDPDGRIVTSLTVDTVTGSICVTTNAFQLEAPTSFRLHDGPAGANGPVVLDLPVPPLGVHDLGCVTASPALAASIAADSSAFYLLAATDDYPDGAVRAQLEVASCMVVVYEEGVFTVEPTDLAFVDEGATAVVRMSHFATGATVTFTVSRGGTVVSTGTSEADDDRYAYFEIPFRDGDAGEWNVIAQDPAIAGCVGTVTIFVSDRFFGPWPSPDVGAGGGTVPDTALPARPSLADFVPGLALAATASAVVLARRRSIASRGQRP